VATTGTGRSLLFELFVANQRVRQLLGAAMADAGLTPDEYAVYSALFEDGALTPTELGRRVGMPPTTVSHYVRALRERRHVTEAPNPADHRSYTLALSRSGLAAHRRAGRAFDEAYLRFIDELTDPEAARRAIGAIGRAATDALQRLAREARREAG
jgi:DNA-binding MarR family transcriptional regulator